MNLENHMALPGGDAPWNRPDATPEESAREQRVECIKHLICYVEEAKAIAPACEISDMNRLLDEVLARSRRKLEEAEAVA